MLHSTDSKKLNKKEGPSEDASILLRRGDKIIMGGRERGWDLDEERAGSENGQDQIWRETGKMPRGPGE